jgi:hypothetical protein
LDEVDAQNQAGATGGLGGTADGIAWRPAIQAAVMLAVPAGVLCSGVTPIGPSLGLLWMGGAAAWAVGLYFKRARPGWLTLGAGARIGLVTGLFASWLTLSVDGVALWVRRFMMHQGGPMDSSQLAQVEEKLKISQQMWAGMGMAAAQVAQLSQFSRSWMLSPEGRAGDVLSESLIGTAFLVCFAMIGGALGARLLAQPRRPSA